MSARRLRPSKSLRSDFGLTTAPESRCEPTCLPFSSTANGTSPSRSATAGSSSKSCPSRIAQARPAGPAPTIAIPTSIRASGGAVGSAIASRQSKGGGKSDGLTLTAGSRPALFHELGELRDDLVEVADDAEIGELEDRRVRVLVDRDDDAGALHADLVLDRARDADGHVELRRDGLARLPDLRRVRVPAGVDDRARRGDGSAEGLRELLDELEVLGPAQAAAPRDDHVGVLDRGAFALGVRLLDHR